MVCSSKQDPLSPLQCPLSPFILHFKAFVVLIDRTHSTVRCTINSRCSNELYSRGSFSTLNTSEEFQNERFYSKLLINQSFCYVSDPQCLVCVDTVHLKACCVFLSAAIKTLKCLIRHIDAAFIESVNKCCCFQFSSLGNDLMANDIPNPVWEPVVRIKFSGGWVCFNKNLVTL